MSQFPGWRGTDEAIKNRQIADAIDGSRKHNLPTAPSPKLGRRAWLLLATFVALIVAVIVLLLIL